MYERAVFAEQAEAPVVQECALPACLHQGDSCAVAVIDPSATIDLRTIHELMVLAEQAKQAMAMLRGAGDLKRVQREWDALEDRSFCMAEDAPDDEGPNVDVGVKDEEKAIGLGSGEVAVRVRELSARGQSTMLAWLREGRERATR